MAGTGDSGRPQGVPVDDLILDGLLAPVAQEQPPPRALLLPAVRVWLDVVAKAVRALRLYAENNNALRETIDRVVHGLGDLLEKAPEVSLAIREDRILFADEVVFLTGDRAAGLPGVLFRGMVRKLTFTRGIARDEVGEVLSAIAAERGPSGHTLAEALKALALPHIDLAVAERVAVPAWEGDPLGAAVATEVAAIASALAPRAARLEEMEAGIAPTTADLEVYAAAGDGGADLVDLARERLGRAVGPERVAAFASELKSAMDPADLAAALIARVAAAALDAGGVPLDAAAGAMAALTEAAIAGGRFGPAAVVLQKLAARADEASSWLAETVLEAVATEQVVLRAVEALTGPSARALAGDVGAFLAVLGKRAAHAMLALVDRVQLPAQRQTLCSLIASAGVPDARLLAPIVAGAQPGAALDLLRLARSAGNEQYAPVLLAALEHRAPNVRVHAVLDLQLYAGETADKLVAERLLDAHPEVRGAAMATAASRKSAEGARMIRVLLERDDLHARAPQEIKLLAEAYATILGDAAVPALARLLNPSIFPRRRGAVAQLAAAAGLGVVANAAAKELLRRGAWTLNRRLREACKRELARDRPRERGERELAFDDVTAPGKAVPPGARESTVDVLALAVRGAKDASLAGRSDAPHGDRGLMLLRSGAVSARPRRPAPPIVQVAPPRLPSSALAPIPGGTPPPPLDHTDWPASEVTAPAPLKLPPDGLTPSAAVPDWLSPIERPTRPPLTAHALAVAEFATPAAPLRADWFSSDEWNTIPPETPDSGAMQAALSFKVPLPPPTAKQLVPVIPTSDTTPVFELPLPPPTAKQLAPVIATSDTTPVFELPRQEDTIPPYPLPEAVPPERSVPDARAPARPDTLRDRTRPPAGAVGAARAGAAAVSPSFDSPATEVERWAGPRTELDRRMSLPEYAGTIPDVPAQRRPPAPGEADGTMPQVAALRPREDSDAEAESTLRHVPARGGIDDEATVPTPQSFRRPPAAGSSIPVLPPLPPGVRTSFEWPPREREDTPPPGRADSSPTLPEISSRKGRSS